MQRSTFEFMTVSLILILNIFAVKTHLMTHSLSAVLMLNYFSQLVGFYSQLFDFKYKIVQAKPNFNVILRKSLKCT